MGVGYGVRHFSTTAHAAYLPQLRVLHASMRRHCEPFRLHILAEGDGVSRWAEAQNDVYPCPLEAFLCAHPDYEIHALPGPHRNGNEHACACRWRFAADIMEDTGRPVTLIDVDQFFFSSPEPVFAEIWDARCAVSPHGFARASAGLPGVTMESHRRFGLYNGGWSYWADPRAARRMAEIAHECSRATDHRWPDGRVTWGDQGALEIIQEEFGAHVIRHPAVNVAPWNVHREPLEDRAGVLHFGDRPLVSYHYSSLKPGIQAANAEYGITPEQERLLYAPYLEALEVCR